MVELDRNRLLFSFPDTSPDAFCAIEFQRTLRIPDDGHDYPLPPGLGGFPLRHVDDFAERVPSRWRERGGVMLPVHQAEAMWLSFIGNDVPYRSTAYPMAVMVAAGKVNAVSGGPWDGLLRRDPQNYAVIPEQPWLDGWCVEKGIIRQFVAMPLGSGCSAEEQFTGRADTGGVQLLVVPMKRRVFEKRFLRLEAQWSVLCPSADVACASPDMGLGAGGRIRQEVVEDPFDLDDWDIGHGSRCFVHLADAAAWELITGAPPPQKPPSAAEYAAAGLPWFEWYGGRGKPALAGAEPLGGLKSVAAIGAERGQALLPENDTAEVRITIPLDRVSKRSRWRRRVTRLFRW